MADMDAEAAFFEAQKQEYDPTADFSLAPEHSQDDNDDGEGEEEEEEEYDPANAFGNPPEETRSASAQSVAMADSVTNTPQPADEGALKAPPADISAAPTPQKQPRTKGGFVDESEDDEDEVPVAKPKAGSALLNASGVSESPQRSVTLSPNNTHAPQAMSSISAQDQTIPGVQSPPVAVPNVVSSLASAAVPNGGTPVPDATKIGSSDQPKAAPASASVTTVPSSLLKARLPQDTIGRLEDRVAEDPRGDIEAWLALIDDHRKRHKVDEARAVFERFFKIFPSAVSTSTKCWKMVLTVSGRNMGAVREYGDGTRKLRPGGADIRPLDPERPFIAALFIIHRLCSPSIPARRRREPQDHHPSLRICAS